MKLKKKKGTTSPARPSTKGGGAKIETPEKARGTFRGSPTGRGIWSHY